MNTADNGETLGRVAGGDRLQEFSSTKQAMVVSFVSDENLSDGGWQLEYYSAQPSRPGKTATCVSDRVFLSFCPSFFLPVFPARTGGGGSVKGDREDRECERGQGGQGV